MKKKKCLKASFLVICMFLVINVVNSQNNPQDVIELKNGSRIKGIIIEETPNQSIKIQTKDGNVYDYNWLEILVIHRMKIKRKEGEKVNPSKPIIVERKRFYQSGIQLTKQELKQLLLSYPESARPYYFAKTNATFGNIFLGTASVLLIVGSALNLGNTINNSNSVKSGHIPDQKNQSEGTGIVIVGVLSAIIGIPFIIAANSQIIKSVKIYNSKVTANKGNGLKINMCLKPNGIGVVVKF